MELPFSLVLLLSLVCCGVCCKGKFEDQEEWQSWKLTHNKEYLSKKEELEKHIVWLSNKAYVDQHNANEQIFGFKLALNHLGDMTDLEYLDKYNSYEEVNEKDVRSRRVYEANRYQSFPESIDWRSKGAVTGIKEQGDCGSSYAFSAIGALEGAASLAHGKLTSLSEQNIIDCSVTYGNHGCKGGNMYYAYQYILANDGVDSSDGYPYRGRQSSCSYDADYNEVSISGNIQVKSGDEYSLMAAVATAGPVAVGVDASSKSFRYYSSGVYNLPGCSSSSLTHAMVITGYGTYKGRDYWLVKNSWGTNWGMGGYIMMSRNLYNQCGIATDASYPTL